MTTITSATIANTIGSTAPRRAEIEGYGEVYLRSPSFAEWYPLIVEQRKHEGQLLPIDVIAKTIAAVLSDSEGNRLIKPGEEDSVLRHPPKFVMAMFNACMDQMGMKDEEVEETKGK